MITELDGQAESANEQNTIQEGLKAGLKTQTTVTDNALQTTYDSSSTKLDAVVSVLGKTTDKGKQGLRLRSDIRRGPNTPPPAPPHA